MTSQLERREPKAGSEYVRVRFVIAEGVRSMVDSVSFQGNTAIAAEMLRKAVTSSPGQPYFEPQISADADKIGVLYLNSGYPEVTVQPAPKGIDDGSKVELHFDIHEGPQILIDHVLIVGNQRTSRETILREVQLKSGQPLSQEQEDETRTRLTTLGLFRRVDISYLQLPGETNLRDVVITVDEAPVTTISYGGGIEGGRRLVRSVAGGDAVEEFQVAPRGFFQVNRRNLFGKDRSIGLFTSVSFRKTGLSDLESQAPVPVDDGGYGFNEYLARLTFGERSIFNTAADFTFTAAVEQGVRSSFDFNRRGANAIFTRRVTPAVLVIGRYGLDHTKLVNIKSDLTAQPIIDRLFPQVRLSSVAGSVIRDTRRDPVEPDSGTLIGADAELAARALGSQVGFFKTFLQAFSYRRLPSARSTVLAFGARVGLATGFRENRQPRGTGNHGGRHPGERTVLCGRRKHGPRLRARPARHARDHRPGRLSERRPRADRAERRSPHSCSRRTGCGGVPRWRQRVCERGRHGSRGVAGLGWFRPAVSLAHRSNSRGPGIQARSPVGERRPGAIDRAPHFAGAGLLIDTRHGRRQMADGMDVKPKSRSRHAWRATISVFVWLFSPQPSALSPFIVSAKAEIIEKVLAIMPGQIITLSDLEAALDLGLVEVPAGSDRLTGGLPLLVDRLLMLNEVRRVVPPEPMAAAIDARIARMRARFGSAAEFSRVLAARGVDEAVLRIYAADDLRLASYLDERFSAASQPTDEEVRQSGEAARPKLAAERRQTLVGAWIADLRRRADVTILP